MPKQPQRPADDAELRRRAEQRLSGLRTKADPARLDAETQNLQEIVTRAMRMDLDRKAAS